MLEKLKKILVQGQQEAVGRCPKGYGQESL